MELRVYDAAGNDKGVMAASDEAFGAEYNEGLIHQVVVAILANRRQGTKSALLRGEVRGGGAKPWKQKGTGRARHGSTRAPQWTRGGVAFAPKPRDFSKKTNKKMRRVALYSALSQKVRQGEFAVLEDMELSDGKTKRMVEACKLLNAGKRALFVIRGENENLRRASNNLRDAEVCDAALLNAYDLVRAGRVFATKDAVGYIESECARNRRAEVEE